MQKLALIAALAALALPLPVRGAEHPDRFIVTSADVADDGVLAAANAGTGRSSFAVLMDDPDAASGIGANHWIVYGVPATRSGLPRNAGSSARPFLVSGRNGRGVATYVGPCAEPCAKPHHFLWTVFALDLPPGVLPPGHKRAAFIERIRGRNRAEASLVTRYFR